MVVILMGASGGLGQYLYNTLAEEYPVIGTYNNHKPDIDGFFSKVNVSSITEVSYFASGIAEQNFHSLAVVNLAGISIDGMGHKMPDEDWDKVIETNLYGTFNVCRAFLPAMREDGCGRIINISSVVGQVGIPGTVAYSASKSALFGLTRTLAAENATKGITVNCLALGYFDRGMIGVLTPEMKEKVMQTIPMKHLGHPSNIVAAIKFLIEADYVTGQVININGGLV